MIAPAGWDVEPFKWDVSCLKQAKMRCLTPNGKTYSVWGSSEPDWMKAVIQQRDLTGKTVLDVGCGCGRMMKIVASKCEHVIGIDSSETMVYQASRYLDATPNAAAVQMDATNMRLFKDASFDFAFSVLCLQHQTSEQGVAEILGEIWRVLRPGTEARLQTSTETGLRGGSPLKGWHLSAEEFDRHLAAAGFKVLEMDEGLLEPRWVWATARKEQ